MRGGACLAVLVALTSLCVPAAASVSESSESGFTISVAQTIAAPPEQVWAALIEPARWWSDAHSWSGRASNMILEPVAGGCFCERWSGRAVEHGRVIHVAPSELLRVRGSLGPLQAEALSGVLSFTLKPQGGLTLLRVDYVVGGHARFPLTTIAPAVDQVITEQVRRLAALLPPGK
jgi:uncharacterized protein YndB with AHSA1/START domain